MINLKVIQNFVKSIKNINKVIIYFDVCLDKYTYNDMSRIPRTFTDSDFPKDFENFKIT